MANTDATPLIFETADLSNLSDAKIDALFEGNGVFITAVSDVREVVNQPGRMYFTIKAGGVERSTNRTLWGTKGENGVILWERAILAPATCLGLMNRATNLGGKMSVTAYDIVPEDFVDNAGVSRTAKSQSVVQFGDETPSKVCATYGRTYLETTAPAEELEGGISVS